MMSLPFRALPSRGESHTTESKSLAGQRYSAKGDEEASGAHRSRQAKLTAIQAAHRSSELRPKKVASETSSNSKQHVMIRTFHFPKVTALTTEPPVHQEHVATNTAYQTQFTDP